MRLHVSDATGICTGRPGTHRVKSKEDDERRGSVYGVGGILELCEVDEGSGVGFGRQPTFDRLFTSQR